MWPPRPSAFALRRVYRALSTSAGTPYASLTVGSPRETYPNEKRVALTPANAALLRKKGVGKVLVEQNAGAHAQFVDEQYTAAGATVVSRDELLNSADILLKVRPPLEGQEIQQIKPGSTLISFLYPALPQNKAIVESLASRNVNSFAMDLIPRISRAQVFDALSSMANIAGYKAVLEASNNFGNFFTGQTTAAGKIPPAKVLVIGAGVAGLSAIVTARRLGAIVRGFDTRSAAREQVQSLGAEFIEVDMEEEGGGGGGYAKVMSEEFIRREMALFMEQVSAKGWGADIVITTALIPGKPAPKLITNEMLAAMKQGSVIVDLAAEAGGNCEATRPGELYVKDGVKVIGYTDLPSRLPTQSSTLYSNNVTKFLLSISTGDGKFGIDLEDEVVRGALVTHQGKVLPRVVPPAPVAAPVIPATPTKEEAVQAVAITPWRKVSREVATVTTGMAGVLALGKATGTVFMDNFFTFGLAALVGYRVVWQVAPALHSPLMSVTNAISGMVGVGGLFVMGGGYLPGTIPQTLGALSVLLASVNVAGGFIITKRMLDMFKRSTDPPEYSYLYGVPAVAGLVQAGYLTSSVLCIGESISLFASAEINFWSGSLSGLSSQGTARQGNSLGMLGVGSGILASLAAVGFPPEVLVQFAGLAGIGGLVGTVVGRRVTPTELPQTVAMLHSVVGLAAVLTSIGSILADPSHATMLHLVTAYLGVVIGGVTFTGSIVAFLKLNGRMASRALRLPGKHLINSGLLGLNGLTMAGFLTMVPSVPTAAAFLTTSALLSFIKGYTTTAAIGGADMPVVITVLNAYSGFALVAEGFMLDNPLLTTVGSLIGVSGSILSYIMCVAMNRSLTNVLFGGASDAPVETREMVGTITKATVDDTVEALLNSDSVILVVGYGMAVSKAQYAISEICAMLRAKGITVRFAIHPVAGRMPGKCNVLLAEASVPYDIVLEMDEINDDFKDTDLTLVIGANDTVNPISLEKGSADCGPCSLFKPIRSSKQVVVMKRGLSSGYADVPNPMFYMPNTKMLFGDAKETCDAIKRGLESRG
ncbi:PNTB-domain-containing protein [Roridomyces roridus]|uniref:NAD(P) transhydrogenase, mitochondrial n=1 Tax=Roridomyces roridus TaxID=1738132 RepID=A0AAD7BWQ8_9AGAR|nr:PNTB-domain-containing protein [Roridomyces roridus]